MRQSRRELIKIGALAAAGGWLSGCKTVEQRLTADQIERPEMGGAPATPIEVRMLNRAAFGIAAADLDSIRRLGCEGWIDQQLNIAAPEPELLSIRLRQLSDILDAAPGDLFDIDDHACIRILRQATILRAAYSRNQLFERMVHFWTDHFNIYAFKNEGAQYKIVDDRDIIRKYALGNFRDLLHASAKSPAMLGYLDGERNVKGIPNENYARELFELHTLGVGGGYTQADIRESARCFTGWRTQRHWHRGAFQFNSSLHDRGEKRVLGAKIGAGGGVSDGETVLDLAASHPSTARHICSKLCTYFIGNAPPHLVDRLAEIFRGSGGEIKPVVKALLMSSEIASAPPMFKRPFDFMISALRALGADTDGGAGVQSHLAAMGQPLFEWPMPDGFPMQESAWVSGLIPRWHFAAALAGGAIENTSVDWDALGAESATLCEPASQAAPRVLFGTDQHAVEQPLPVFADFREAASVAIMAPDFQYR